MTRGRKTHEDFSEGSVLMGLMDAWEADTDLFLDEAAYVVREGYISIWKVIKFFDLLGGEQSLLRQRLRLGGVRV